MSTPGYLKRTKSSQLRLQAAEQEKGKLKAERPKQEPTNLDQQPQKPPARLGKQTSLKNLRKSSIPIASTSTSSTKRRMSAPTFIAPPPPKSKPPVSQQSETQQPIVEGDESASNTSDVPQPKTEETKAGQSFSNGGGSSAAYNTKPLSPQLDDENVWATTPSNNSRVSAQSSNNIPENGEMVTSTSTPEGEANKELFVVMAALTETVAEQDKADEDAEKARNLEAQEDNGGNNLKLVGDDETSSTTSGIPTATDTETLSVPSTPTSPTTPNRQSGLTAEEAEVRKEIDDVGDIETHSASMIAMKKIDVKSITANTLGPREQEREDEPMLRGVRHLFNNRFVKAKQIFETKSQKDPLFALGLGAMAFMKAIMTFNEHDIQAAVETLTETYTLANAQIEAAKPPAKSWKDSVADYFATIGQNQQIVHGPGVVMDFGPPPPRPKSEIKPPEPFMPNGVLRAHVIKAECCLLIALTQMMQETFVGYVKSGLNLRRAYNSYTIAWNEYKRINQEVNEYVDRDTISGIQFGIGSVHLILGTLPPKILKIISALGWKGDKQLGFALLKLCLEGRRIRSPLASLMLLAYYTILSSFAPQILGKDYTQPAIETLLDAQRNYPNSAFFLYFAGRTSRLARNLPLSNQSFQYATEITRADWAQREVRHLNDYELGFNFAMSLDWEKAGEYFERLGKEGYWSPAFCKYFYAACLDISGVRADAILAYAEVPNLVVRKFAGRLISIEQYVTRKVQFFQQSGYQDIGFNIPALEILLIWNCFSFMERQNLEKCLALVDAVLDRITERERAELEIRMRELAPNTPPPNYFDQRGVLLLIKSSIQNSLHRYNESIVNLNWILDHREQIKGDRYVVAFAYWEAGVTMWGLGNKARSRKFWETALGVSKYEFEYRLAVRLNLGILKCEELGIHNEPDRKAIKGLSSGGPKRMSLMAS